MTHFDELLMFLQAGIVSFLIIIGLSALVWESYRKTGVLNDIETLVFNFETDLRSAIYWALIYPATIPFQVLVVIGASTFVALRPGWFVPIVISLIVFQISLLFVAVITPIVKMFYSASFLGAIMINNWVRVNIPLRYYEPKVCEGRRPEDESLIWNPEFLQEPETRSVPEIPKGSEPQS